MDGQCLDVFTKRKNHNTVEGFSLPLKERHPVTLETIFSAAYPDILPKNLAIQKEHRSMEPEVSRFMNRLRQKKELEVGILFGRKEIKSIPTSAHSRH
jgi:hypothetical protein|tara:strand:- start:549 stop:842 length:294 start_codon:yes stop_codon:yes gene_type:complete